MVTRLPRVLVAAPASGQGKTTVATGLMAALRARGEVVSPHKVGPDYIDPGFHALACGRPGRNLDPWLCGEQLMVPLLLHGARVPEPATVAVLEGAMGLFDGRLGGDGFASAAHVAALTGAPVLLVVDTSHTSRSIGAVVHGMATYDKGVRVGGVVLNKVGSTRHEAEVRRAIEPTGVPVLGCLARDAAIEHPSRHLGLVPADESDDAAALVAAWAGRMADAIDLDAVLALAGTAPDLAGEPWDPALAISGGSERAEARACGSQPRIAIFGGRAFTFRYRETAELLAAAGCEPVEVDPLHDRTLPAGTAGLYLGGGFPQVHADELAGNVDFAAAVRQAVAAGMPTVAECAGLLYLGTSVDGVAMSGALPHTSAMAGRLQLGYRTATAPADTLLAHAQESVTGHEFHRTRVADAGAAPAWAWDDVVDGVSLDPAGTGQATVHASYLHVHWAGHPHLARRFAAAVHTFAAARPALDWPPLAQPTGAPVAIDLALDHHGDRDRVPGTVDLAVNVDAAGPPDWLAAAIAGCDVTAYPDPRPATEVIAAHHGLTGASVLPTAGAAEAFTLVARAWAGRGWCVVHPQFTEPEAALRTAGARVHRHVLRADDGFRLDVERLLADCRRHGCDVVMVGNPTNPTSVRHPRADLERVAAAGLTVVVDEAFLDGDQAGSLVGHAGVVVIRSLTKLWAIPGVRAGWLTGPADVVAELARFQPPWSVSSPAVAAMLALHTPAAHLEQVRRAGAVGPRRDDLVARLTALGVPPVANPAAPFVLVDTRLAASPRAALAGHGFSVRRGETFPGLGPSWLRLAVRTPAVHERLCAALSAVLTQEGTP